jgi:hypothetical protein
MSRLAWVIVLPDGRTVNMRGDEDQMDAYVTRVAGFDGTWTAHPKKENWWGYSDGNNTVYALPKEDWNKGTGLGHMNSKQKAALGTRFGSAVGKTAKAPQKVAAKNGTARKVTTKPVEADVKYRADYSEDIEQGFDIPANVRRLTNEANLPALKDKIAEYEQAEGEWPRGWSGKWKGLHYVVSNNRGAEQYRVSIKKVAS